MGKFLDNPILLIVLLVIIILVFGANKLPGAARSLGRSMRIFKSEVKHMKEDDEPADGSGPHTSGAHAADHPIEGRVVDDGSGRPQGRRATQDSPRDL